MFSLENIVHAGGSELRAFPARRRQVNYYLIENTFSQRAERVEVIKFPESERPRKVQRGQTVLAKWRSDLYAKWSRDAPAAAAERHVLKQTERPQQLPGTALVNFVLTA